MVSVIIVNWNGRNLLQQCLDGLRQQVQPASRIIVVDNGSTDGSNDFVRFHYPEVELIELRENLGFATANNIALRSVKTPYVALLNNDAVPDREWLRVLVEALHEHAGATFAASKMVFADAPGTIDRAGDAYTRAGAGSLRGRGARFSEYDKREWIFGACAAAALYRTDKVQDAGNFDDDFFLIYEDVDLSFRMQILGYRCLYVPEALVYHKGSSSIGYDSPLSVYYGHRNLEWVYAKNMPGTLILCSLIPHLAYNVVSFIYFSFTGLGRPFLRAKLDALKGMRRVLKKRRIIQKGKRADDHYIWKLLEKEKFYDRLARRARL